MHKAVESVLEGHPDKVCDQIADAIVDEFLRRDPDASVNLNVLGSHGMVMIGGETHSHADFDMAALAKEVYRDIGYADDIEVFVNVEGVSGELANALRTARGTAIVHGYATRETRERLPRPLVLAHTLARRLDNLRKTDPTFAWMRPDGKVQLVVEKDAVKAVTMLVSHAPEMDARDVQTTVLDQIVTPIAGEAGAQIFINPNGAFTVTGFQSVSGANGRKQGVDLYGALIPHTDHALSGKDPLHPERAGTYLARYAACSLVEQGLAASALVNVVYTLGRAEPISIQAMGTGEKSRGSKMDLTNLVKQQFDFRPEAIAERFDLKRPLYRAISAYGQVGRPGLPWEEVL